MKIRLLTDGRIFPCGESTGLPAASFILDDLRGYSGGRIKYATDLSALSRLTFQVQCCADDARAVAHDADAHPFETVVGQLKTRSIVTDGQNETVVGARQGDGDVVGPAVFGRV